MTAKDKWPLFVAMTVAGVAAVVASSWTLAALARGAGWVAWSPWLLPAALDVGTAAGVWCWLRPGAPVAAKRFAKRLTVVGSVGTLAGNACGHLLLTGLLKPDPGLVVVVGAVPAAVLVSLAHLAALLTVDRSAVPVTQIQGGGESGGLAATAAIRVTPSPAEMAVTQPSAGQGAKPATRPVTPPRPVAVGGTPVADRSVADQIEWLARQLSSGRIKTQRDAEDAVPQWKPKTAERRMAAARKTATQPAAEDDTERAEELA